MSTDHRRVLVSVSAAVTVVASACASEKPTVVVVETITQVIEDPAPDGAALDDLTAGLPGGVGVAVVPVGGGKVLTAGTLADDVAWSTIKVPLAIAALDADPSRYTEAAAAIGTSDNDAAQHMWDALGSGTVAAARVREVLVRFGDADTAVQPDVVRPGFTAFGQTRWPLPAQARFTAMLPCRPEASSVLALMGQVSSGQSWGLGALPGARFKGGWGPGESGDHLVRQLAVVDAGEGEAAVAVSAHAATFDQAVATVDEVAGRLAVQLPRLGVAGRC